MTCSPSLPPFLVACMAGIRTNKRNWSSAQKPFYTEACDFYLKQGRFPDHATRKCRPAPVLTVGVLPYAGDDGGEHGQAYRLRIDLKGRCCVLAFRCPGSGRSMEIHVDRAADSAFLARSSPGAPPGRGKSRANAARDLPARWHALRHPQFHCGGARFSPSRSTAGTADLGMGLGRAHAGHGNGGGPTRATGSLPHCFWTPVASTGGKPTLDAILMASKRKVAKLEARQGPISCG